MESGRSMAGCFKPLNNLHLSFDRREEPLVLTIQISRCARNDSYSIVS